MKNHVRARRLKLGLAQGELARLAGISRQSLLEIEAWRAAPSVAVALRLARALGSTVDALFGDDEENSVPVSARLRGRIAMAWLGERWVAHALGDREHDVAADATLDRGRATFLRPEAAVRQNVLVMGCAPALGPLCDCLGAIDRSTRYVWLARSSSDALRALREGSIHVAGLHLGENVADARAAAPRCSVVTLAHWQVGLLVAAGNPLGVRRASDVARRGVRFVTREKGSGARRMLERALAGEGLRATAASSRIVATSHRDVARCVATGACDVGPGTLDVARASGLDFVPLGVERFDLAIARASQDDPRIARMLDALASSSVRRELRALGYDTDESGRRVA